jgi:hypothetical protein
MKEMTAHDRFLERQRIANERSIEMGYGKAVEDAIVGGTGITKDGKRIDPASIYAEPKIGCVNHDCDKCKAVQEPIYQMQMMDGKWIDQAKQSYEYNKAHGNTVRIVYTTPPAAQPAPVQPVGCMRCATPKKCATWGCSPNTWPSENTTPPAPQPVPVKTYHDGKPWPVAPKPWVGLTDEERNECTQSPFTADQHRAIEAKLKEKNGFAEEKNT